MAEAKEIGNFFQNLQDLLFSDTIMLGYTLLLSLHVTMRAQERG